MKYSIRLDFDTDVGRKQLLEGLKTQLAYDKEVHIAALTDESHIDGMILEIEQAFGSPGESGIAGFMGYEITKEEI